MSNFDSLCRICLNEYNNLIELSLPLFPEDETCTLSLLNALKTCVSSQITQFEGKPNKICEKCKILLESSYSFYTKVIHSEERLKVLQHPILIKQELNDLDYKIKDDTFSVSTKDEVCDHDCFDLLSVHTKAEIDEEISENDQRFDCTKCSIIFTNKEELLTHSQQHEEETICPICSKKFYKYSSFEKHVAQHKPIKQFQCNLCDRKFKREGLLLRHMIVHNETIFDKEDRDVQCPVCKLTFKRMRSLNSHMKKHKGFGNNLKCDVCSKEFRSKDVLRRHVKLHSEDRYKCAMCPKTYSRQSLFIDHMNGHNGVKTNTCPYCNKAFNQLCNLKDHVRTHTGETPYLCSQCGKGFSNSSNLRQHMMRHTGVKPFSCALCPKTFCTKGQMRTHMTTHTDAQPFKCEECGAGFNMASSLKKHKVIHLGTKDFQCDACPRRFRYKDHLKRHYRIHTGEKPFKCKFCDKTYSQSNDLIKHIRIHVGQNIYECKVCSLRFRLQSELKQHYPIHYNNEIYQINDKNNQECQNNITQQIDSLNNVENSTITITFNNDILDKDGAPTGNITININDDKRLLS